MPLSAQHNRQYLDDYYYFQHQDLGMFKSSQPQKAYEKSTSAMTSANRADRNTHDEARTQDDLSRHVCSEDDTPAFRMRTVWGDTSLELNDLWTLKRATPIVDENDRDDYAEIYQSPTKKSRVQTLSWSNSVDTETSHCLEELCRNL
jgi:hypothetical protein